MTGIVLDVRDRGTVGGVVSRPLTFPFPPPYSTTNDAAVHIYAGTLGDGAKSGTSISLSPELHAW